MWALRVGIGPFALTEAVVDVFIHSLTLAEAMLASNGRWHFKSSVIGVMRLFTPYFRMALEPLLRIISVSCNSDLLLLSPFLFFRNEHTGYEFLDSSDELGIPVMSFGDPPC